MFVFFLIAGTTLKCWHLFENESPNFHVLCAPGPHNENVSYRRACDPDRERGGRKERGREKREREKREREKREREKREREGEEREERDRERRETERGKRGRMKQIDTRCG